MDERDMLLRHFLASIAYHASKAIRDAPPSYPELDVGMGVRTPRRILHHVTGVLCYAHSFFERYETTYFDDKPWGEEVEHFYEMLRRLDASMAEGKPREVTEMQLLQGPLSDVMAHVGQMLMLRRLAGSPVPSENFIYADIKMGRVGPDQPDPVAPDE
jgi:hypothetical protein